MKRYDIGIDFRMSLHTGIGTYLRGLTPELLEINPAYRMALFGHIASSFKGDRIDQFPFSSPIYSVQEQIYYPSLLNQCRLWHAPHYNVPLIKGRTRLVVTIHDLIHWVFRNEFLTPLQRLYAALMFHQAVHASDHIITVSEHTKQDLIRYFSAPEKKISVIYEAVSSRFKPAFGAPIPDDTQRRFKLFSSYFLYVGMLKTHKNIPWLVTLFQRLYSQQKLKSKLLIVGKLDRADPATSACLKNLPADGGVLHANYVSDFDLTALYQHATALVHPSLYEGFGLTLLEAMACGTPVLALKTSSIPEISGTAAFLVNPHDEPAFEQALIQLETSETLRQELGQKGIEHVSRFSWKKAAEDTHRVYEQVLA